MGLCQREPVVLGVSPAVFASRCCKLVSDQFSIFFGNTNCAAVPLLAVHRNPGRVQHYPLLRIDDFGLRINYGNRR